MTRLSYALSFSTRQKRERAYGGTLPKQCSHLLFTAGSTFSTLWTRCNERVTSRGLCTLHGKEALAARVTRAARAPTYEQTPRRQRKEAKWARVNG